MPADFGVKLVPVVHPTPPTLPPISLPDLKPASPVTLTGNQQLKDPLSAQPSLAQLNTQLKMTPTLPPELVQEILQWTLASEDAVTRRTTRHWFRQVCKVWEGAVPRWEEVVVIGSASVLRLAGILGVAGGTLGATASATSTPAAVPTQPSTSTSTSTSTSIPTSTSTQPTPAQERFEIRQAYIQPGIDETSTVNTPDRVRRAVCQILGHLDQVTRLTFVPGTFRDYFNPASQVGLAERNCLAGLSRLEVVRLEGEAHAYAPAGRLNIQIVRQ